MLVEMSRDPDHGGVGWEFSKCLWSPTKKPDGSHWPYWSKVRDVKRGELILHLRGKPPRAFFTGFSTVSSDGYFTEEKPPKPGQWSWATEFFRADLESYNLFPDPIPLVSVFANREADLRAYFQDNKLLPPAERRLLFYVIQSKALQCQNGAYLTDLDTPLASIILGVDFNDEQLARPPDISVATGHRIQVIRARLGQSGFSQSVKSNHGSRCCFPGCTIDDPQLLVGAHIARWADREDLRGRIDNGLCLCLMHDRAFEEGYFTLDLDNSILPLPKHSASRWHESEIAPFRGRKITCGRVLPLDDAIKAHWKRHRPDYA